MAEGIALGASRTIEILHTKQGTVTLHLTRKQWEELGLPLTYGELPVYMVRISNWSHSEIFKLLHMGFEIPGHGVDEYLAEEPH